MCLVKNAALLIIVSLFKVLCEPASSLERTFSSQNVQLYCCWKSCGILFREIVYTTRKQKKLTSYLCRLMNRQPLNLIDPRLYERARELKMFSKISTMNLLCIYVCWRLRSIFRARVCLCKLLQFIYYLMLSSSYYIEAYNIFFFSSQLIREQEKVLHDVLQSAF